MPEYIEREELLKTYKGWLKQLESPEDEGDRRGVETCISVLRDTPSADVVSQAVFDQIKWERDTALKTLEEHGIGLAQKSDVVEVVRCKKCIHYVDIGNGIHYCSRFSNEDFIHFVFGDNFCSYGERRSN